MKRIISIVAAIALCIGCLAGCSSGSQASSSQSANGAVTGPDVTVKLRIGTMPTEDILPMWVAEQAGMFKDAGLDAEVVSFDSAQALSAAITAGEVDMAMVDVMRAVKLCEAGTPVVFEWVTLGEDATQGAFGVMASADAPYSTLTEMSEWFVANPDDAGSGVGVAANTVPEYVFDKLCEEAGIDPATIPTQEIASLPERYSLMASGNMAAAALPGSMLELGKATGLKLIADDTTGENISQSIMVATELFSDEHEDAIEKAAEVWDEAVAVINSDPQNYASVLAEKANLNEKIAADYPVATYPYAMFEGKLKRPSASLVNPQIMWMADKGYSTHSISYDEKTGTITVV